jgi:hypothetical protein
VAALVVEITLLVALQAVAVVVHQVQAQMVERLQVVQELELLEQAEQLASVEQVVAEVLHPQQQQQQVALAEQVALVVVEVVLAVWVPQVE